jgi:hypothetical protein
MAWRRRSALCAWPCWVESWRFSAPGFLCGCGWRNGKGRLHSEKRVDDEQAIIFPSNKPQRERGCLPAQSAVLGSSRSGIGSPFIVHRAQNWKRAADFLAGAMAGGVDRRQSEKPGSFWQFVVWYWQSLYDLLGTELLANWPSSRRAIVIWQETR